MSLLKVLYFNNFAEDYLADGILLGLKKNPNVKVYEFPVKLILYKDVEYSATIRGKGFTLYNLIEKGQIEENINFEGLLHNGTYFDIIIFSSVHRQFGLLLQYYPSLSNHKVAILDGEDNGSLFPNAGFYWRRPYYWFLPRVYKTFKYFKREITADTNYYRFFKLLPRFLSTKLPLPQNVLPLSFSFPEEKIVQELPTKSKLFPKHIVDLEVAAQIPESVTSYAFESEEEYYRDIRISKFGITTKRSGWDCLRHYEIAANGTVLCFRNLHLKPTLCAPHGLVAGENCLSYTSYADLMRQINSLSELEYQMLQSNTIKWVKQHSTINKAKELLAHFGIEI